MNKKLYIIIQVLVLILAFCISPIFAIHATSDLAIESQETFTVQETLSTEGNPESTETQEPYNKSEPMNTEQKDEQHETQSTLENAKHPQSTEAEEPQEATQTLPPQTEEVPFETQIVYDWYYAYNAQELEIRNDSNEVINSMPSYSIFRVLWVDEDNPSLSYIDREGCVGYISDNNCIIKIPDIIEFECYFARTLCELNLRDPEGELIELIPVNSLVYVIGTSSNDSDRATIINMSNGKVGTIAHGNVEFVEDAIFTSIQYQNVTLLIGGKLIVRGYCVTGTENRKDTPKGAYTITGMKENETLLGGKKCDYCMHFYDGCCFHDADWRSEFGGTIYRYNGSSGCVNCSYELAKTLYENCYIGLPVYIV